MPPAIPVQLNCQTCGGKTKVRGAYQKDYQSRGRGITVVVECEQGHWWERIFRMRKGKHSLYTRSITDLIGAILPKK